MATKVGDFDSDFTALNKDAQAHTLQKALYPNGYNKTSNKEVE